MWTPTLDSIALPEAGPEGQPQAKPPRKIVQTKNPVPAVRQRERANRPVRPSRASYNRCDGKVWQGFPMETLRSSGPGGY